MFNLMIIGKMLKGSQSPGIVGHLVAIISSAVVLYVGIGDIPPLVAGNYKQFAPVYEFIMALASLNLIKLLVFAYLESRENKKEDKD